MFRVGQFAKLSQVSARMLRHYDELGLVKPERVDSFTGYRYYSSSQLARLNRLRALRDMGLSLEQVGRLLDNDITPEQITGMLKLKEVELEQRISEGKGQLVRVRAWLKQLERPVGKVSNQQVVIKSVEPVRVASIRDITPGYEGVTDLTTELLQYLAQHGVAATGNLIVVYHSGEDENDTDIDQQACLPITADLPESDRVKVGVLPALETAASLIHQGPWEGLAGTYAQIGTWLEENRYNVVGPNRDYVIKGDASEDPGNYSCELVFPVAK